MKFALVAPSGYMEDEKISKLFEKALKSDLKILTCRSYEKGIPSFLMGSKEARLKELILAHSLDVDAILSLRGGVGAIELWHDYDQFIYKENDLYLIGYSDITILHFKRFFFGNKIGIHGPVLSNLFDNPNHVLLNLQNLINNKCHQIIYPKLKNLYRSKNIKGPLIIMNFASLQTLIGLFDLNILKGSILALEDINEPHYKMHRMFMQLKHMGIFNIINGLILGYFNLDRKAMINETVLPIAKEHGLSLFDWPIFGHDIPNWPLYFGKEVNINRSKSGDYEISYA